MSLKEVRSKIQRIDEELLNLIEKRTRMAKEVLAAKKAVRVAINDVEQNKVVLDRVVNLATERGLDGDQVKKIFEILINMNIERQHELSGEGNLP